MPIKDKLVLRAQLVDRGRHNNLSKMSERVLKATEDQMISMQVWRIPHEKISFNTLNEGPEEAVGVNAKDDCSISVGMGKYILSQTNREIIGEILIEIGDKKTIPGLMLPEIVYSIKKKLGCIFVENHNLESMVLKRGQSMGLLTSCVVTQEEKGQTPTEHSHAIQSFTGTSNDTDTRIGGSSEGDVEKAGWKADSVVCRK